MKSNKQKGSKRSKNSPQNNKSKQNIPIEGKGCFLVVIGVIAFAYALSTYPKVFFTIVIIMGAIFGLILYPKYAKKKKAEKENQRIEEERRRTHEQLQRLEEERTLQRQQQLNEIAKRTEQAKKATYVQKEVQKVSGTVKLHEPLDVINGQKLKYFYKDVKIYAEKNLTVECKINDELVLKHEPDNEYDENAVAVLTYQRVKLGYLFKGKLQQMVLDFMKNDDDDVIAKIASYNPQNNEIIIALAFYKKIRNDEIVEKFRVSVSENKYYENYFSTEGYEVDVSYDVDKGKYMIEEFAKLPERFEHYAEDDDYIFVILDDKENDSGSHSIQIGIIER